MLFKLLQEKDLFEKYYKQHLSIRLLGNTNVSENLEKSMILRLKVRSLSFLSLFPPFWVKLPHKDTPPPPSSFFSHPQTECGFEFTAKLERMFKDMTISTEMKKEFCSHIQTMLVRASVTTSGSNI